MYNKNLYLCVISAKSSEGREEVARHLRYWPYVKFFKYQGDRHLLCCFCLGEAKDGYQLKQLYERSRQLVLLCLRQYDVTITRWKPLPDDFKLIRNNRLFTRPDSTLRPFITFMGDSGSDYMIQDSGTAKIVPLTSKDSKINFSDNDLDKDGFVPEQSSRFFGSILKMFFQKCFKTNIELLFEKFHRSPIREIREIRGRKKLTEN